MYTTVGRLCNCEQIFALCQSHQTVCWCLPKCHTVYHQQGIHPITRAIRSRRRKKRRRKGRQRKPWWWRLLFPRPPHPRPPLHRVPVPARRRTPTKMTPQLLGRCAYVNVCGCACFVCVSLCVCVLMNFAVDESATFVRSFVRSFVFERVFVGWVIHLSLLMFLWSNRSLSLIHI